MALNMQFYRVAMHRKKAIDGIQVIAVARLHEALTEAMQLSDELT